ncbi:respiratory nitrate reductase gamma subunit [Schinkia azotoformans MEV2011]|uniref:Respiratory nitrate reductase subunit gamma n=2 Tax=Schinkia azotoformans TaxID=1454 RepID=K6DEW2_SCHAZ|nr:respiratory nitrate reductase subunit gamma [Schinkia azotoformans]EKN66859.1 respiratory nitrate reductase subunit gamma [Schinkia azotoformans LMG 9581]KEF35968.1 respiratory nitrate reductase gamma subunit [Schinkia azotoformans MEV2011]MEC1639503.1 respiratory nitrate reductase subunit gamma [Schinkia azotoformans]MEC1694531.1 respiratory nitrate reductase subunit gamma [Schinkia azotoformans]MEC1716535.1 respiratory nitrate reductase subunit gamma [Schinkia azotoformans]
MINQFLWVVLPYIVLTIFIGGHIYRYNHDQFGWTTKSSQLLEKKLLRVGSNLFHWGIIFVFGGHVMGLLIPIGVYEAMGVNEHQYHTIALLGGIPAGIAATLGIIILTNRRMTVKRILQTSTKGDWVSLFFLLIVILSGMSATLLNLDSHGFDYRTTIGPWLRGVLMLQADASLLTEVPLWFKIHMIAAMGLFAAWPFTRLVHVFSVPLRYLTRSYVIYRKREPKQQSL